MTKEPFVDGAFDVPAITDYHYEDVMGDVSQDLPKKVLMNKTPVYDQSRNNNPSTTYACTRYGTTHGGNENNAYEGSNLIKDPLDARITAINNYGANVKKGDSLRSALAQAKDENLISGYAIIENMYQAKYALSIGQCLYTGTSYCDWTETRKTGVFTPKPEGSYGHAFAIIGYDETGLIARNSYGEAYEHDGIKGSFLIPYDETKRLFTIYALIDHTDIDKVKAEKIRRDNENKQKMIELGIWNGKNEDDPVTRGEVAIMLGRIYENLK